MASVRKKRGGVDVELSADEIALLKTLPAQLAPLLEEPLAPEGTDAVRDRLFPRAYLDPTEESAEGEWQAMVHPDLVRQKAAALATLAESLDAADDGGAKIRLDLATTEAWLAALNDARLALGTTIGITEDHDPNALDPDDPGAQPYFVYDWLTWLQGSLVETLL